MENLRINKNDYIILLEVSIDPESFCYFGHIDICYF